MARGSVRAREERGGDGGFGPSYLSSLDGGMVDLYNWPDVHSGEKDSEIGIRTGLVGD